MKDYKSFSKIKNEARNLLFKKRFRLRLNHNHQSFNFKTGIVPVRSGVIDDRELIERLKKFYGICSANFDGNSDSVWSAIFTKLHGEIHSAFINSDDLTIADILRNPEKYNLFYGFENLCRDLIKAKRLEDILEPELAMDSLISLCEAVGVLNTANPESLKIKKNIDADTAISLLEKEFGFSLNFPNPFKGEYGLTTTRGIVSYRAVQAIYQAWKIFKIVREKPNAKVIEIGGGLGRTAYYCRSFGILDYTIVDIPISSLSQANFIGRTLSQSDLHLIGEPDITTDGKIKLIHTKAFFASEEKYDLVVNVDSLTELDITIAKTYLDKIAKIGKAFLSINHENNSFSVNSISKEELKLKKLYRNLYWLRRGYVEEFFEKSTLN